MPKLLKQHIRKSRNKDEFKKNNRFDYVDCEEIIE